MMAEEFDVARWGYSWDDTVREDAVQGRVSCSDDGIILSTAFGTLLGEPGVTVFGGANRPESVDQLFGFTLDGYSIVLKRVNYAGGRSSYPGGESQRLRAQMLFVRKGAGSFDVDEPIEKIHFGLEGLRAWFGKTVFRMEANEHFDFKMLSLVENVKERNCILLDDDELRVRIYHTYVSPMLSVDDMTFRHDCIIEVVFKKAASLDDALAMTENISRFVSFCAGFHAGVKDVYLQFSNQEKEVRVCRRMLDWKTPTSLRLRQMPFPYSALDATAGLALGRWLRASKTLSKVQSMLVSLMMFDWRMPIDVTFSAVSQAFDALSKSCADTTKAMPSDQFKEWKRQVQDAVSSLDEPVRNWVMERLGSSNQKGQNKLIGELLSKYEDFSSWMIPDRSRFAATHLKARNWYAHPKGEGVPLEGVDLFKHTGVVLLLMYGIVWLRLGVDPAMLIERLRGSGFRANVIDDARRLYG